MFKTVFAKLIPLIRFGGSKKYWESRYRLGGTSGDGSYGQNADYKAKVVNGFVEQHHVRSAIEFGCGDGNQLELFHIPYYTGVDVSASAIIRCRKMFSGDSSKSFFLLEEATAERAELALSLDVVFHLVEDNVYQNYLSRLVEAATRYVLIYSTDVDMPATGVRHVRHREVSKDIQEAFPALERLWDFETSIAPPVKFDRGHPTKFMAFRKR